MVHSVEANGAMIPAIGLGTWTLKGDRGVDLVARAIETGYRHVDTARSYGNEREVGEGIRASGVARERIFVTTKVWYTDIAPGDLERSAEASLGDLGLDHVDLLLIHWPNPDMDVESPIRALNAAKAAGLTRHIGVSNFPTQLLARAIAASEVPLVANQVEHHPYLDQSKVYGACRSAGISMVAFCPLARGGELFKEPVVREAAGRHHRTPAQIVLRWQVQTPGVVAIPRTGKIERLAENLAVGDFELDAAEMAAISALGSRGLRICDYAFSPDWD
jgi:diketogulonate reductase-like aldo/keto reductase